jgi:putative CocE/NonD family hydrolase
MNPQIAPINPFSMLHRGGVFAFEIALMFVSLMPKPPSRLLLLMGGTGRMQKSISEAAESLPLVRGYIKANHGRRSLPFEDWMSHSNPNDQWWAPYDFSAVVDNLNVPVLLQGAWLDMYTNEIFAQYQRLRERGVDAALMMADTSHSGFVRSMSTMLPSTVAWFQAAFVGDQSSQAGTILGETKGSGEWQSFTGWPPQQSPLVMYLHEGAQLAERESRDSVPDSYQYDPSDPTPSIGGELLAPSVNYDNKTLVERADVLFYSSELLDVAVEIAGPISVELYCTSSLDHTDFFVRLCNVFPTGEIRTVGEAVLRINSAKHIRADDGVWLIKLNLSQSLCRFETGHRISLLICSGAHPRFARNTGTGEPLATASSLRSADQKVYHDSKHPSKVTMNKSA